MTRILGDWSSNLPAPTNKINSLTASIGTQPTFLGTPWAHLLHMVEQETQRSPPWRPLAGPQLTTGRYRSEAAEAPHHSRFLQLGIGNYIMAHAPPRLSVPLSPPQPSAHPRATIGCMNPSGTALGFRSSKMAVMSALLA